MRLAGIEAESAVDLADPAWRQRLARGRHLSVEIDRLTARAGFLERKAARLPLASNGRRKAARQAAGIRQTVALMRQEAER